MKWKTGTLDETVEKIFTKFGELDPEFKKTLVDLDYYVMETKLNEDAAIVT